MSKLIVAGISTSPASRWPDGTAYLQIFYHNNTGQAFSFSTGEVWQPSLDTFYREIPCTVASNIVTVSSVELDTTTDVVGPSAVRLTMRVLDATRSENDPVQLAQSWEVPTALEGLTAVTYEMLRQHNTPAARQLSDNSQLSRTQWELMLAGAVAVGNPATTSAIGRVKASATPVDAASPTAYVVGDASVVLTSDSRLDYVTPKQYGAVGTGSATTITSADVTAHAVGTQYPWRGSYTVGVDTKDYVGLQEAIYAAFGGPLDDGTSTGWHKTSNAYLNKKLFIPGGSYKVNKQLLVVGVVGAWIEGSGRRTTTITVTSANTPVLYADGISYSRIAGINFSGGAASNVALVELDYTGSYTSLKPQQITIADCQFEGNGSTTQYGLRIAKAGATAQGDTILVSNCIINNFTQEGLSTGQQGAVAANALSLIVEGGNIQNCTHYGLAIHGGSFIVNGTSFQAGVLAQYDASGYDIYVQTSANDKSLITGVRTESLRFLQSASSHHIIMQGVYQGLPPGFFATSTAVSLNQLVRSISGPRTVTDLVTTSASATVTSATANFTQSDVGKVLFPPLNHGLYFSDNRPYATIQSVTNSTTAVLDKTANSSLTVRVTIPANSDGRIWKVTTAGTTGSTEPYWTGSTITSGTAVFEPLEYNTVDAGSVTIDSCQFPFGRIKIGGYAYYTNSIKNSYFSRPDWLNVTYNVANTSTIDLSSNYIGLGANGPDDGGPFVGYAAARNPTNNNDGSIGSYNTAGGFNAESVFSLSASQPLIFPYDLGGTVYPDVGLFRNDGAALDFRSTQVETFISRNVLGVVGTLGKPVSVGTNVPGRNLDIQGGLGTGSGGGGSINFRTQPPGSSGTTVGNAATVASISPAGLFSSYKGANVASASTITPSGNLFHVTGTTTITAISTTGLVAGTELTIIFDGALTFTDGGTLKLNGDFVTTADDTIKLVFDGTNFYELSRSTN